MPAGLCPSQQEPPVPVRATGNTVVCSTNLTGLSEKPQQAYVERWLMNYETNVKYCKNGNDPESFHFKSQDTVLHCFE